MKYIPETFGIYLALAGLVPTSFAHWNYNTLIVNGAVVGSPYQYIRRTDNSNSPIEDVKPVNMDATQVGASGANTQTYTVAAGSKIGFGIIDVFGHPGPQQVYLSKAPSSAASYDGSGNWLRIYSATTKEFTTNGPTWAADGAKSFVFTLPASTPPGEYLIKVTGSGSGSLSPSVKFPGAYTGNEPGILFQLYWPTPTNYTAPGPALWPAGTKEAHSIQTL